MRNAFFGGLLLASLLAAPAHAQEAPAGSVTFTIEGSFGIDLAPPSRAAAAPPPPVLLVEPARGPLPSAPSAYQLDPASVLRPAPALYVPPAAERVAAPRYRRRVGLIVSGAVLLGGMWALNLGGTAFAMAMPSGNAHREELGYAGFLPIVGPLAQIAFRDDDWQIPLFAVASAVQLTGLVLAIVGSVSRVPVDVAEQGVTIVPYASAAGAGLNVVGGF